MVVSATVDEILVPGLFVLEHDGNDLLVLADAEEAERVRETEPAYVQGDIRQFDFADIEAEFPGAADHQVLEEYESAAVLHAERVALLDEED